MTSKKLTLLATFLTFVTFSSYLLAKTAGAQDSREDTYVDTDNDGLGDIDEITIFHTDPNNKDSDNDGYDDGLEIKNGYSPTQPNKKLREIDTDDDGLWDDWEIALGSDLKNPDSDGDGYKDGIEVNNGYSPTSASKEKLIKRIEVNLNDQSLQYYLGDFQLDNFKISSGLAKTPTPAGNFTVIKKRPIVHYAGTGYNYPNTKWNLAFKRGNGYYYYVHGAYWHNNFGKPMSHGCVNVPYKPEYMGRLYDWSEEGTVVNIN